MDDIVSLTVKINDLQKEIVHQDEVIERQRILLEQCKQRLSTFHEENLEYKKRLASLTQGEVPALCKAG